MARSFKIGVSGVFKILRPWFIGVSSAWKQILAGYIGVSGAWKKFYSFLPDDMIVQFESAPGTGWSELSYDLYPIGASAAGGSNLYSNTHEHATTVANVFDPPQDELSASTAILRDNAIIHHHANHDYNHTHGSTDHKPFSRLMRAAVPDGAVSLPTSARLLYYGTSAPSGWSDHTYGNGEYLAFTTGTYGTLGATTHTHTHGNSGYDDTNDLRQYHLTSYQDSAHHYNHYHPVNSHPAKDNKPLSARLHMIKPSSEAFSIPSGVVAFFTGSVVPAGWSLWTTGYGRLARLWNASVGTQEGSSEHGHAETFQSGDFGAAWFRRGQSAPSTTIVTEQHQHTVTGAHASATNNSMPLCREFMICKKD